MLDSLLDIVKSVSMTTAIGNAFLCSSSSEVWADVYIVFIIFILVISYIQQCYAREHMLSQLTSQANFNS